MEWARAWPIVCQFGVGSVLCAIGLAAGARGGYFDLKLKADRRLLGIVAVGFIGLLILSCLFTFWLPQLPAGNTP